MKLLLNALSTTLATLFLASCGDGVTTSRNSHVAFKARGDYRSTMEVYKNESAYAAANPSNTRVRIDLSDQRAQLLVGPEKIVAIDTPVCTGRSGKRTPVGRYPITQKKADKRSTIYGTTFYRGKRVHGGDRRKYSGRRDRYVGASLPYWMRMTGTGIGMHGSSSVKRYPASGGCVRTPHHVVPKIYQKVKIGTPIEVVR